MAYTDLEKDKWIEIAQDTGESLEKNIPVLSLDDLDNTVTLPGVKFDKIEYDAEGRPVLGKPQSYVQAPLKSLKGQKGDKGDKGEGIDYRTMTPAEYQKLVRDVKEDILFASESTCESIIDELN